MNYAYAADLQSGMIVIIPELEETVIVDVSVTDVNHRTDGHVDVSVRWDAAGDYHDAGTATFTYVNDSVLEVA
jgi:hypothetical protein